MHEFIVDETNLKQSIALARTLGFPKIHMSALTEKVKAMSMAEKVFEIQAA